MRGALGVDEADRSGALTPVRVLLLAHAVPLARDRLASGNSVRADALARGLAAHGIEVVHAYPAGLRPAAGGGRHPPRTRHETFGSPDELGRLIARRSPDALVVGFWELLESLPSDLRVPVVADVLAPRLLEMRFEPDRSITIETLRMLSALRRADRFLCGNERQRHFLLPWLLMAGFACEPEVPIDIVPLAGPAGRRRRRGDGPWLVVSGGVDWPWRRAERYLAAAERWVAAEKVPARLVRLSGGYVYRSPADAAGAPRAVRLRERSVRLPLLSYGAMESLFRRSHVGLELSERNLEREYSASFRSLEFLRAGTPIVLNDYLELAASVDTHRAGWVVSSPRELPALLRSIVRDRRGWEARSAGALDLARARFHPRRAVAPLVRFLRRPVRALRGAGLLAPP